MHLSKTKTAYYTPSELQKTAGNKRMKRAERKSALPTAFSPATAHLRIVILDLSDRRKRYLDDLAVRAFHLDAWGCESLSGFHATNDAPYTLAINCNNLNIIFTVKRL
jgi:hypothetical protein